MHQSLDHPRLRLSQLAQGEGGVPTHVLILVSQPLHQSLDHFRLRLSQPSQGFGGAPAHILILVGQPLQESLDHPRLGPPQLSQNVGGAPTHLRLLVAQPLHQGLDHFGGAWAVSKLNHRTSGSIAQPFELPGLEFLQHARQHFVFHTRVNIQYVHQAAGGQEEVTLKDVLALSQDGLDQRGGVAHSGVEQCHLQPPGIMQVIQQFFPPLFPTVNEIAGGQILLKGEVREAIDAQPAFHQQATALPHVLQELARLCTLLAHSGQGPGDDLLHLSPFRLAQALLMHPVGQWLQHAALARPVELTGDALGLIPVAQQHLGAFIVQLHPPIG